MKLTAAIAVFLALALPGLPTLVRDGRRRELFVYLVIALIAGVYLICFVMEIETFSLMKALSVFVKKTLGLSYNLW